MMIKLSKTQLKSIQDNSALKYIALKQLEKQKDMQFIEEQRYNQANKNRLNAIPLHKTERELQQNIVSWFKGTPNINKKAVLICNFNEMPSTIVGKPTGYAYEYVRRSMGVEAGVPDLTIITNNKTLFIELKKPNKEPKLSDSQTVYHQKLKQLNIPVIVINDYDICLKEINNFVLCQV